jgi:hypothetical protein
MDRMKYLTIATLLILLFLFSETNSYADAIGGPIVAGLGLILIVGIIVAVVFFLAYFLVWLAKRKK